MTNNLRTYPYGLKLTYGVNYVKLPCPAVITEKEHQEFRAIYLDFQEENPGKYVGVHCFTGDERSKTMVCNFLELDFGMATDEAEEAFDRARIPFKKV